MKIETKNLPKKDRLRPVSRLRPRAAGMTVSMLKDGQMKKDGEGL